MANAAAQWFYDCMMFLPVGLRGRRARMARRLSAAGIYIASRVLRDPVVTHSVHGARLALPMSHALPRILLRFPEYSANLGRIAAALQRKYPKLAMIDIGANVGDTIAIVRRLSTVPMLCIDGDPNFFQLLKRNAEQWGDIELERAFVGVESGRIAARMDSRDGSGHLSGDSQHQTDVVSLPDILERHPRFQAAKLLKVDTDGFDTLIVKGAGAFLQAARPAVYLEYDPHFFLQPDPAGFDVFASLRDNGYAAALFFWNTGDFHTEARLEDEAVLKSLHAECSGQGGKRYFDVCVFHQDDVDLCDEIRGSESARRQQ